jgi:hypothetical protein
MNGIIRLTPCPPGSATRRRRSYRAAANDATSSDNTSNPSRWNGARALATTTNGSSGTASVHSAGNETSPSSLNGSATTSRCKRQRQERSPRPQRDFQTNDQPPDRAATRVEVDLFVRKEPLPRDLAATADSRHSVLSADDSRAVAPQAKSYPQPGVESASSADVRSAAPPSA